MLQDKIEPAWLQAFESVLRRCALQPGDTLLCCSDGLWHYFTPRELGMYVNTFAPREAGEMMVTRARQRANGQGDNVSLALLRVEALP